MPANHISGYLRPYFLRRLANYLVARDATIFFTSVIDENVPAVGGVFYYNRRGHIVDDLLQKLSVAIALAFDYPLRGDVFERRHPSAVYHRLIDDAPCALVGCFYDPRRRFTRPHSGEHVGKGLPRIVKRVFGRNAALEKIEQ